MRHSKIVLATLALTVATAITPGTSHAITREQEIEFNANHAAHVVKQLQKQEKTIAALPKKEIAIASIAGRINQLGAFKKESGKFSQEEFTYIMSIVLYRLGTLSQDANMPPAVTSCHLAEARNMENVSKGLAPVMPNCRTEAYAPNIQSEGIVEVSKPSWAPTNELIKNWVVNAFSYAEALGKISNYGKSAVQGAPR